MKTFRVYLPVILILALIIGCRGSAASTPAPKNTLPALSVPTATSAEAANTATPLPTSITLSVESVWTFNGDTKPFLNPVAIALDGQGNLSVLDQGQSFENMRIIKIDSDGKFLSQWSGEGNGKFIAPNGIVADGEGNVYVSEGRPNSRVIKFDSNGKFLAQLGDSGNGDGQFDEPGDLAIDAQGQLFVADIGNNRIQKFDSTGKFLTAWGDILTEQDKPGKITSLAVDLQGNVYIGIYARNTRIVKYDNNGGHLLDWTRDANLLCSQPDDSKYIGYPAGMWFDSQGHLYVADNDNAQICVFDMDGKYAGSWGAQGSEPGQLNRPVDVVGDGAGNVYVLEDSSGNNRVQKLYIK